MIRVGAIPLTKKGLLGNRTRSTKPKWTMPAPGGYTGNAREVRSGEGRFLERRDERLMHFLPRQGSSPMLLMLPSLCPHYTVVAADCTNGFSLQNMLVLHLEFHGK